MYVREGGSGMTDDSRRIPDCWINRPPTVRNRQLTTTSKASEEGPQNRSSLSSSSGTPSRADGVGSLGSASGL